MLHSIYMIKCLKNNPVFRSGRNKKNRYYISNVYCWMCLNIGQWILLLSFLFFLVLSQGKYFFSSSHLFIWITQSIYLMKWKAMTNILVGSYLSDISTLAIDESMVVWHVYGNLSFRVYSPDKHIKYDLKAYMLCDAENAYCLKLNCTQESHLFVPKNFEKGHILFFWRLLQFSSVFMDLWILGTGATETIRPYRKGIF